MAFVLSSIFKIEIQDLITLKKAEGFKYDSDSRALARIDRFFVKEDLREKVITKGLSDKWCSKTEWESHSNWAGRISSMRVLSSYLFDRGYNVYVPPKGIIPHEPRYDAHIYTEDELRRFFKAVDESESIPSECPYRGMVMPIFFRILYTSGLRCSELRLVKLKDMHEDENYLVVVNGKNNKDRIVPIHPILAEKCKALRKAIHQKSSEEEYFFMQLPGRPITLQCVYKNFRRYLAKAGITHTGDGPRVHDFRWTYCVNRLKTWVEEGKDLLNYLPYMKTMLGHETFKETAYYLKLTKELFPTLTMKLESYCPGIIQEVTEDEWPD